MQKRIESEKEIETERIFLFSELYFVCSFL